MFPPEIFQKICQFLDLKSLNNLSQVNPELENIANQQILKMEKIVSGTFVSFKKNTEDHPDEDTWTMKKIVISKEDNKFLFRKLNSWSTEYTLRYDDMVGEYSFDQDDDSFSLPPDGSLRAESGENITVSFTLIMEGDNSCKLEIFSKGDKDVNYSMTMIWKNNDVLYQTVKLGEEEDITVFRNVILDNFHYLVVNDDDSNTFDNYLPYVYISPSCLDSLTLPWPYLVRLKGASSDLVTMLRVNNTGLFRRHVRDQHIRINKEFREFLEIGRGEAVEIEPCSDVQSGEVELKVTSITRLQDDGPVDFMSIIRVFLEDCSGVVFNQGFNFEVRPMGMFGVLAVEFQVERTFPSPACLVEKVEQVKIVET
jgi:hypothetical protein